MKIKNYIHEAFKKLPTWVLNILGINNEEDLQIWFEWKEKDYEKT